MKENDQGPSRAVGFAVAAIGITVGIVVAVVTSDVILGVIAGSSLIAITVGVMRLWTGSSTAKPHGP